jgi:hypothetical protein
MRVNRILRPMFQIINSQGLSSSLVAGRLASLVKNTSFQGCISTNKCHPIEEFGKRAIWTKTTPSFDQRFPVILDWIERCLSSHDQCREGLPTRPKRLIYLERMDQGEDPMFVSSSVVADTLVYTALSHCWEPETLDPPMKKTTTENLEQHLRRIVFDELPPNHRDAITVTRRLGIRYIWIDCL